MITLTAGLGFDSINGGAGVDRATDKGEVQKGIELN